MPNKINLKGSRFKKLLVLEETSLRDSSGSVIWKCQCDCGNIVYSSTRLLRTGDIVSCGCFHTEFVKLLGKSNKMHGLCNSRLYTIYTNIKQRCFNKLNANYYNCGGRGIKVCDEWKDNFMNFYNWAMNNGYKDDLTIERIDVNGDYEPDNCKWILLCEQAWNKRNTRKYIDGRPLSVVCNEVGIDLNLVYQRIDRDKMSIYDAVNKPIRGKH